MTKRQTIDQILNMNRSAKPEFLAQFDQEDLDEYLRHLHIARSPRLCTGSGEGASTKNLVLSFRHHARTQLVGA